MRFRVSSSSRLLSLSGVDFVGPRNLLGSSEAYGDEQPSKGSGREPGGSGGGGGGEETFTPVELAGTTTGQIQIC